MLGRTSWRESLAPRPRLAGKAKGLGRTRGRAAEIRVVRSAAGGSAKQRTACPPSWKGARRGWARRREQRRARGGVRVRGGGGPAGARRGGARVRGVGGWRRWPRRRAARREHGARERRALLADWTVSSRQTRPGPRGDGAVAFAGVRTDFGDHPGPEPQTAGVRVSTRAGAGECVRGARAGRLSL